MQPVLDGELARHPEFGPALRGVDLDPVLAFARTLLSERPRTGIELRAALAERFPGTDPAALAYACRNLLAFVQLPPRGVWGRKAQVTSTTAESWLGRPLARDPSLDDVVCRYLAAFGPASAADVAAWSRLTTCCCRTPTAADSSRRSIAPGCPRWPGRCTARCSTTASCAAPGGSNGMATPGA